MTIRVIRTIVVSSEELQRMVEAGSAHAPGYHIAFTPSDGAISLSVATPGMEPIRGSVNAQGINVATLCEGPFLSVALPLWQIVHDVEATTKNTVVIDVTKSSLGLKVLIKLPRGSQWHECHPVPVVVSQSWLDKAVDAMIATEAARDGRDAARKRAATPPAPEKKAPTPKRRARRTAKKVKAPRKSATKS